MLAAEMSTKKPLIERAAESVYLRFVIQLVTGATMCIAIPVGLMVLRENIDSNNRAAKELAEMSTDLKVLKQVIEGQKLASEIRLTTAKSQLDDHEARLRTLERPTNKVN